MAADEVDLGGTELYIQELERHIDEVETAIQWCISNGAIVDFTATEGVIIRVPWDYSLQSTFLDAVNELRPSP